MFSVTSGRGTDFGCGAGVLGAVVKRRYPQSQVTLLDVDAFAVESSRRDGAASFAFTRKRLDLCRALIAEGDEVLDWREMVSHYQGARIHLLDGSDHAVSDFEAHLPALVRWLFP